MIVSGLMFVSLADYLYGKAKTGMKLWNERQSRPVQLKLPFPKVSPQQKLADEQAAFHDGMTNAFTASYKNLTASSTIYYDKPAVEQSRKYLPILPGRVHDGFYVSQGDQREKFTS